MKAQIAIEALVSLVAFVLIVGLMFGALNNATSSFEKDSKKLGEIMKANEITAYCNLVYMKGRNSVLSSFPDMGNASKSECFSESYYPNTKNPGANASRRWF